MPQKIGKKLPKRTSSAHRKEYRANAWRSGQTRKAERIAEQNERHAANVAAGKTARVHKPKQNNMRLCNRCEQRMIVGGSVCWCRTIGADIEARRRR